MKLIFSKGKAQMESDQVVQLLVEIRDIQQAHLKEYCRVTQESLELARLSVHRQQQFGRLWQRVLEVMVFVFFLIFSAWNFGLLN